MHIDESDEQHKNADFPRPERREPDSNVTFESALHPSKQRWQITSTDDGMQIDGSDEQCANASLSIRER
jgi:hypothetical protein